MKLIEPKAEYISQEEGLEGVYKQIELAGRTCYKSEDKITEESAKPFVDRMIASNHLAMLEHGTVYLIFDCIRKEYLDYHGEEYCNNPYSKVNINSNEYDSDVRVYHITTNLRVLVENNWLDDLHYLSPPTKFHEKRYTFKFTCDRGVSHELVRHRVFSFAQESQRYCNYSKDKYGREITFIKPSWLNTPTGIVYWHDGICWRVQQDENNPMEWFSVKPREDFPTKEAQVASAYFNALSRAEEMYFSLLREGCNAQEARAVLPNTTKTEICMTGFASDWRYFFDLRLFGKTGAPHPDMLVLANKAKEAAEEAGIWKDIMNHRSKFKEDDSKTTD